MGWVVAFHLFRVVIVNMGAQYIYAFIAWALGRSSGRKEISTSKS